MNTFGRSAPLGMLCCVASLAAPSGAEAARFQQTLAGACGASAVCKLDSPVVAAGKTVEVTNVSCHLRLKDPGVPVRHQLQVVQSNGVTVALAVSLQPFFIGRDESIPVRSTYVSNHSVLATAIQNQRFRVTTTVAPPIVSPSLGFFFEFSCHISGTQTP